MQKAIIVEDKAKWMWNLKLETQKRKKNQVVNNRTCTNL